MTTKKKQHWENVFHNKRPDQVSWTQEYPSTSMEIINTLALDKSLPIIDVGGGDSKLVDALLEKGYTDISVLDISEKALSRAKDRLGSSAKKVSWIVSDIVDFKPQKYYALWHDRASFHFLTDTTQIKRYTSLVEKWANKHLVLGTFSTDGPLKCSGLPVKQYNCTTLTEKFQKHFECLLCKSNIHTTPFDTKQHFIFSSFIRKS